MILAPVKEKPPPLPLPPLTRNDYCRSAEVEEQIRAALALSRSHLRRRIAVRDHEAADFLQEEALALLIRHYYAAGNRGCVEDLSGALIARITGRIKRWLRSIGLEEGSSRFDDAFCDVIAGVFAGVRPEGRGEPSGGILDLENDKADFAQVLFWPFLDGRIGDVIRRAGATRGRNLRLVEIEDVEGHGTGEEGEGALSPLSDWDDLSPELSPEAYALKAVDEAAALNAIKQLPNEPRPLREVVRLWYLDGWQVESKEPEVITISIHYGKTPRTIRNWLREAEGLLATILKTS